MKEKITVRAEPRAAVGTSSVRRLRRTGQIPAVVYSEGKPGEPVQVNAHDFAQLLRHHRGEHMLVTLKVGESERQVLLKDVQHHPVDGRVIHVDFYEVSMTRKVRVEVPVRLVGTPVGVSQQGGILDHLIRAVIVECLPSDIPEELVVDVSNLRVGHHLTVGDIPVDAGRVRIVTARDIVVAAVSLPKAEEMAAPTGEAAEGAAAAEPEVITAKAKEGEGDEAAPAQKGGAEKKAEKAGAGAEKKAGAGAEKKASEKKG